ncbi:MAG: hypothetical protein P1U47_17135 [Zhongshania sp.]|uniref:hypothetical protein n=1 Tax=Zhongshania sp. TaxID=1971902 RepID=UPI0026186C5D|nr:hypothetical protein [Zhongshania sp.]MDF1694097.1 hypothetical protein [Zhongshania sp.]
MKKPHLKIEQIAISRFKRELNQVSRNLKKGSADGYTVTKNGKKIAFIMSPRLYAEWLKLTAYDPN